MITERSMNIIVTAGGTSEPIDNVRRIANTGTGRLGSLVADELAEADWTDHIFYVCAKDSIRPVSKRVTCVEIQSVADLQELSLIHIFLEAEDCIQNYPVPSAFERYKKYIRKLF